MERTAGGPVDDLDGSVADERVEFAVDGRRYEIHLSSANVARLRAVLAPYIAAGRRVPGRRGGRPPVPVRAPAGRALNQTIRGWAREQGMTVAERGRIPAGVVEAYHRRR